MKRLILENALNIILGEHWADGEYPSVDKRAGIVNIFDMENIITADDGTSVMPSILTLGKGFGSAFGTSFALTASGNCFKRLF